MGKSENNLLFKVNSAVVNANFTFIKTDSVGKDDSSYAIKNKDDFGGVTFKNDSPNSWLLTVEANRHGDGDVATWFKKQVGTGNAIATDNYDDMPGDLSFAIKGEMELTSTILNKEVSWVCEELVIAQGHNARSRNNWWIGCKNMLTKDEILPEYLHGEIPDGAILFRGKITGSPALVTFKSKGVSEFELNLISIKS